MPHIVLHVDTSYNNTLIEAKIFAVQRCDMVTVLHSHNIILYEKIY